MHTCSVSYQLPMDNERDNELTRYGEERGWNVVNKTRDNEIRIIVFQGAGNPADFGNEIVIQFDGVSVHSVE